MTMSVVSGRGRVTRDAIAAASVSRMILMSALRHKEAPVGRGECVLSATERVSCRPGVLATTVAAMEREPYPRSSNPSDWKATTADRWSRAEAWQSAGCGVRSPAHLRPCTSSALRGVITRVQSQVHAHTQPHTPYESQPNIHCLARHSPIIHSLVRRKEHKVEALEDIALLNLAAEEEADGVVEGGEGRLEHELVARAQRPDDVEVQVGRRAGEDEVRREGVDLACGCNGRGKVGPALMWREGGRRCRECHGG